MGSIPAAAIDFVFSRRLYRHHLCRCSKPLLVTEHHSASRTFEKFSAIQPIATARSLHKHRFIAIRFADRADEGRCLKMPAVACGAHTGYITSSRKEDQHLLESVAKKQTSNEACKGERIDPVSANAGYCSDRCSRMKLFVINCDAIQRAS